MQLSRRFKTARFYLGHKIFLLVLLTAFQIRTSDAQRSCYQCEGINCQRTTYEKVETCSNDVDICATVFMGQTIQAQGCLENIAENLRMRCDSDDVNSLNECHKCNGNLCNKWAASSFQCIQCDSNTDSNCANSADSLQPTRCPISRSPNEYCYTQKEGNRVVRGCTSTLAQQRSCMSSEGCAICEPSELNACNNVRADTQISPDPGQPTTVKPTTNPGGDSSGSVMTISLANYLLVIFACFLKFY